MNTSSSPLQRLLLAILLLCSLTLTALSVPVPLPADAISLQPDPSGGGGMVLHIHEAKLASFPLGNRILESSADMTRWEEVASFEPTSLEDHEWLAPPSTRAFFRLRIEENLAGSVFVEFADELSGETLGALQEAGLVDSPTEVIHTEAMRQSGRGQMVRFQAQDPALASAILAANTPLVRQAFPDVAVHGTALPTDPFYQYQWHLSPVGIDMSPVWSGNTSVQKKVIIAYIDTGGPVRYGDAPFWTNLGEIPGNGVDDDHNGFIDDLHGYSFIDHNGNVEDDNGHGSFGIHLAAATHNNNLGCAGVADSGVEIMVLKVLDAQGNGSTSTIVEALDYCTMMKSRGFNIQVANLSLGTDAMEEQGFLRAALPFREALARASQQGIVCVMAAGNQGLNCDQWSSIPASISPTHPSGLTNFTFLNKLVVGATTQLGDRTSYSNYGASSVNVFAPGGDSNAPLFSADQYGQLVSGGGTSYAAPLWSGLAAVWGSRQSQLVTGQEILAAALRGGEVKPQLVPLSTTGRVLSAPLFMAQRPSGGAAPVAKDDRYILPAGASSLTLTPLENDLSEAPMTIVATSQPTEGSVQISGNSLIFTKKSKFARTVVWYQVSNGTQTAAANIEIFSVDGGDVPPEANDDEIVVNRDVLSDVDLRILLNNDREQNGQRLRIHSIARTLKPLGFIYGLTYSAWFVSDSIVDDYFDYEVTDGTTISRAIVHVKLVWKSTSATSRILSPAKNQKVSTRPVIKYRTVKNHTAELEICAGLAGKNPHSIPLTGSNLKLGESLPSNSKLFARIRLTAPGSQPGKWSPYLVFYTKKALPPARPKALFPENFTNTGSGAYTFKMAAADDPEESDSATERLRFVLAEGLPSDDRVIANHLCNVSGEANVVLQTGKNYYWRTVAENAEGATSSEWLTLSTQNVLDGIPTSQSLISSPAPGSVTGHNPSVSWNSVPKAQLYRIQILRADTLEVLRDQNLSALTTTLDNRTLPSGVPIKARVMAFNAFGNSGWSAWVQFTTSLGSPVRVVSPASGATGLPRSITVELNALPSVNKWDYECRRGGELIAGYGITYDNGPYTSRFVNLPQLNYSDVVQFRARARIADQDNPWTAWSTFTVLDEPMDTPVINSITRTSSSSFRVNFAFGGNCDRFECWHSLNSAALAFGENAPATVRSLERTGVSQGLQYVIIKAIRGSKVTSSAVATVLVEPPVLPAPAITSLTKTSGTTYHVGWSYSGPALSKFEILQSTNGTDFVLAENVASTTFSASHDVPTNQTYYIIVRAVGAEGQISQSTSQSILVRVDPPTSVTAKATTTSGELDVTWAFSGAAPTRFEIWHKTDTTSWVKGENVPGNLRKASRTGLPSVKHYVRVKVVDQNGVSSPLSDSEATATPKK